jgi:hypothetical protein
MAERISNASRDDISRLDNSRRGYLSSLTRIFNQIDPLLNDYSHVVHVLVKELQSELRTAWANYQSCCSRYTDENVTAYQVTQNQLAEQCHKKQEYDEKIDSYLKDSIVYYSDQGVEGFAQSLNKTPTGSVRSASTRGSRISNFSDASQRLRETRDAAAKAAIVHKHVESKKRREVELELKRMELEIKQREFELQQRYELAQIEIADEVQKAKDDAELANLEAELARQEFVELAKRTEDLDPDEIPSSPYIREVTLRCGLNPSSAFRGEPKVLRQPTQPMHNVSRTTQPTQPPTSSTAEFSSPTLLNTLVTTIEKIGFSHDFPTIEIQKFNGSPHHFPVFRHRFDQMINSKPIEESVKMSRLLQLLEGPPLDAVRRYEAVDGGLTKALKSECPRESSRI